MLPQITCASALLGKTQKHENCIFTRCISALPEFNSSLLNFFNLFTHDLYLRCCMTP